MGSSKKNNVQGKVVSIITGKQEYYITLTDIARYKDDLHMDDIVKNWMRNRNTIELLGFWEQLHNPGFRKQAGLNSFTMNPKKWIESMNAVGVENLQRRLGNG